MVRAHTHHTRPIKSTILALLVREKDTRYGLGVCTLRQNDKKPMGLRRKGSQFQQCVRSAMAPKARFLRHKNYFTINSMHDSREHGLLACTGSLTRTDSPNDNHHHHRNTTLLLASFNLPNAKCFNFNEIFIKGMRIYPRLIWSQQSTAVAERTMVIMSRPHRTMIRNMLFAANRNQFNCLSCTRFVHICFFFIRCGIANGIQDVPDCFMNWQKIRNRINLRTYAQQLDWI